MSRRVQARYVRERIFKVFGLLAILTGATFLFVLLFNIVSDGMGGFYQARIKLEVSFDPDVLGDPSVLNEEDFERSVYQANMTQLILGALQRQFPDVRTSSDLRRLVRLVSRGARWQLRHMALKNPDLVGTTRAVDLLASDDIDQVIKGNINIDVPESDRRVKDKELGWLTRLQDAGLVSKKFHHLFLTSGDSREPELAGIWGAVMGSALTLLVTLVIAFPIGVMSAIYLEEFAPQNRLTDLIEININNLAAVPSIVFGLLGLAVFLNVVGLPRSAPIVGGVTLALMTLPTIIIASRAAIKAVPPSIRDAARGLGASPMQVVFHHVLPVAMPGILTGTIIGMAQALGETAPLLMIGMVAFIVDIPNSINDAATVLPVQIYLWAESPERAFVEKTSAAIMVLMFFLICMNGVAIWLRQRFEKNW
ncbi:phosphate ABC transporter permease PstA [Eilatimonas milleporae]